MPEGWGCAGELGAKQNVPDRGFVVAVATSHWAGVKEPEAEIGLVPVAA